MQYLNPLESLEKQAARDKKIIIGIFSLLAIFIVFVPQAMKKSNPILMKTDKGIVLSEVEPWKLSVARIEEFTHAYLSDRFVWSEPEFSRKRQNLATITNPAVMTKLKDSLQAFEAMTHNQKAKSYYVLEEFRFSNEEKKIFVQITRVLRIQSAAIATPLKIELSYADAPLSPENPYGLIITTMNEAEVVSQ